MVLSKNYLDPQVSSQSHGNVETNNQQRDRNQLCNLENTRPEDKKYEHTTLVKIKSTINKLRRETQRAEKIKRLERVKRHSMFNSLAANVKQATVWKSTGVPF